MLELHAVTYRCDRETHVDRVDAAFESGTITLIVGPAGAGQSSLLRLISGELRPTSGHVTLNGRAIGAMELAQVAKLRAGSAPRRRIGCGFTVKEVVEMGSLRGRPGTAQADAVGYRALEIVDALDLANRAYDTLSDGQALRVDVARSIVTESPYILIAEPAGYETTRRRYDELSLFTRLTLHGMTVIAARDRVDDAMLFADRVIVMHEGQIVAEGLPEIVLTPELLRRVFALPCRPRSGILR